MTIETQVTTLVAAVAALTQSNAEILKVVSATPTPAGSTPVDNTAVLAAIAQLQATTTDIQNQLETPASPPADSAPVTPSPSPAPDATPTPAPAPATAS